MRDLGHTTEGACEHVETHVIIDSPEPEDRIRKLLEEAEGACMAHHAMRNAIPFSTRLIYNNLEVVSRSG